jgi:superkiller protein 8
VTPTQILSASGASSIKVHSTTSPDIPLAQTLTGAHKLGCHHIVTSRNGRKAASAGFGGEVKIWGISESGEWASEGKIEDGNKAGEIWAVALSEDGQFLASTTYDGRINVWDLVAGRKKIREYETKGSFGMCIDMSRDGRFTASGHENGGVYVFNNDTGRMLYSLPGKFILWSSFICILLIENRFGEASTNGCVLTSWYSSCSCWRCKDHCLVRCSTWRASCKSHWPFSMDLLGGLE